MSDGPADTDLISNDEQRYSRYNGGCAPRRILINPTPGVGNIKEPHLKVLQVTSVEILDTSNEKSFVM